MLLAADGRSVLERLAGRQEGARDVHPYQRVNPPQFHLSDRGRSCPAPQPEHSRLGQLLLPGYGECCLSGCDQSCLLEASSVAGPQDRQAGLGITLLGSIPACHARLDRPSDASASPHLPCANVWFLVREPDAVTPPVRFDERAVETEHGGILWHRPPKGPATRMVHLHHRATARLYPCRWPFFTTSFRGQADPKHPTGFLFRQTTFLDPTHVAFLFRRTTFLDPTPHTVVAGFIKGQDF
jgi:hypothetical protein